ncbi:MAG: hypothetical protein AAF982_00530, partial [Pseudomonadota bacterium]
MGPVPTVSGYGTTQTGYPRAAPVAADASRSILSQDRSISKRPLGRGFAADIKAVAQPPCQAPEAPMIGACFA